MKRKYKISEARKLRDLKQTDFDKRIDIFTKINQGWSGLEVAKFYGQSHQSIYDIWSKIKDMTIEELEELRRISTL
jgi:hypothetical protein